MKNNQTRLNQDLIEIAMALTSEKDYNRLLNMIVSKAMAITKADGGTLYILSEGYLYHRIMHTTSMGISKGLYGDEINIDPLILGKSHIASHSALEKKTVKVDNVYNSMQFDNFGAKEFDDATGYNTISMLVCPMINRNKQVVGVLQLVNSLDKEGRPIPFEEADVSTIESFASLAGISIENMNYFHEIRELFESFVEVVAKTIDERTPYNKLHSENLSKRVESFARYLNSVNEGVAKELYFSNEELHKLVTASWLHDIGKIVMPLEMLDKADRLDYRYENLMNRYDLIQMTLERNYYLCLYKEGYNLDVEKDYQRSIKQLDDFREFIKETNQSDIVIDKERQNKIDHLKSFSFEGVNEPVLTDEEYEHLSIIRGTLTTSERELLQGHMTAGERILSELNFPDYLEGIYDWIIKHHEYLDGSGYPHQCVAENISIESRILTILDIFDSLVQSDRPYKKAIEPKKALSIIKSMAQNGKLDLELVMEFENSGLWATKLQ